MISHERRHRRLQARAIGTPRPALSFLGAHRLLSHPRLSVNRHSLPARTSKSKFTSVLHCVTSVCDNVCQRRVPSIQRVRGRREADAVAVVLRSCPMATGTALPS